MNLAMSAPAWVSNMLLDREPGGEGHGFSRAENLPSTGLYLSFTRATHLVSAFTGHHSPVTNHRSKGRNSRSALHTRKSQKTNDRALARAERPGAAEFPIFRPARYIFRRDLAFHPSPPALINPELRPGTVNRVEAHVSRRKQTTGKPSTRNVPPHPNFRRSFASVTRPHCSRKREKRAPLVSAKLTWRGAALPTPNISARVSEAPKALRVSRRGSTIRAGSPARSIRLRFSRLTNHEPRITSHTAPRAICTAFFTTHRSPLATHHFLLCVFLAPSLEWRVISYS